mmetsp:Transcript_34655/g.53026  ORF Transcript_34655/g.53026 Transcript_34655/m.53026 type:complete len:238 (+) Transcript_34655:5493-6206(+)|eukprot:CAMPEP_0170485538 /NCGR_PEP_ID=MMETSP0208-20121228/4790_1 /TAXON_ID=197538 /ORGANISM="Strombidium inclinatum, Strain S3" /LENGTH=237 /DNA_ID=CAMNT_0010759227 /DNA_START=5421 /DNA_END=6134 /DNA_ORIENTATION=+
MEAFFKILYFIRIFESFGFLVQMVFQTVQELVPFTVFFMMWIVFFAFSLQILEVQIVPEDGGEWDFEYWELNEFIKQVIVSYRNSIGDISAPAYENWLPLTEDNEEEGLRADSSQVAFFKYFIITFIWMFWMFNQYINLIILLNFLIAVISQTYEKVISRLDTFTYMHKAELNSEFFQVMHVLRKAEEYNILLFKVEKQHKDKKSSDWQGMIQTIRSIITKSNATLAAKTEFSMANL